MKIATWNINSVRLRAPLLAKLVKAEDPEIICLQETKCPNEHFPLKVIKKLGFEYNYFHGEKGYNGVAILSKLPLSEVKIEEFGGRTHCRHISAALADGTRVHNFYIPAGGDIPDPKVNPSFAHKLQFLDDMIEYFTPTPSLRGVKATRQSSATQLTNPGLPRSARNDEKVEHIILGDFNVAPFEHDVWSHKQLLKIVSHTLVETERLDALYKTLGWIDVGRHFVPMDQKLYTWWSYRNKDWKKSNRGRRLDHIWVTPNLRGRLVGHKVLREARDWARTSDHVPVIVEISIDDG